MSLHRAWPPIHPVVGEVVFDEAFLTLDAYSLPLYDQDGQGKVRPAAKPISRMPRLYSATCAATRISKPPPV